MTLSNPTSGSVQISALGFLAAVFCCAASASSACEVIPISAQTAYVGIPTYPNKINQRLQQIPVIYQPRQDAIVVVDEAGVLCHGGAFDIPAVPFQGWSILKLATASKG